MAIVPIALGTAPTGEGGDSNRTAFGKVNDSFVDVDARAYFPTGGTTGQIIKKASGTNYDTVWASEADAVLFATEAVSGGAGFVDVSGAVTLDLATGRAFHHKAIGNMTGPTFSNVPAQGAFSAVWTWVVWQDATGGRTLSGTPTVRFVDGASFADLNTVADTVTIFTFWRVGSITYGAMVTNEALRQDAYRLSFGGNGAQLIVAERAETVALGSVTNLEADGTAGTGTLTYKKNGSVASGNTALVAGDVLEVTLASSTTPSAIAIPRLL